MRIAIVSDTHGSLDAKVFDLIEGVDRILHCGDVGTGGVLQELGAVATTDWVRGNCDLHFGAEVPDNLVGELDAGKGRFLLTHVLGAPRRIRPVLQAQLQKLRPSLVFFGHSHQPELTEWSGRYFLNPGALYRPRGGFERSVALLDLREERIHARIVALDGRKLMEADWPLVPTGAGAPSGKESPA